MNYIDRIQLINLLIDELKTVREKIVLAEQLLSKHENRRGKKEDDFPSRNDLLKKKKIKKEHMSFVRTEIFK